MSSKYHKVSFGNLNNTALAVFASLVTVTPYAVKATLHGTELTEGSILGAIGLLVLLTVMVPLFKYTIIILSSLPAGEASVFALWKLANAKTKIKVLKEFLIAATLAIVAGLLVDVIMTQTISLLTCAEAINSKFSALKPVPIAIGLVIFIGILAQFGTASKFMKIAGYVMPIWILTLISMGVIWIVQEPMILKALTFAYIPEFIIAAPGTAVVLGLSAVALNRIGGSFLVMTGSEAISSDKEHFGSKNTKVVAFIVVIANIVNVLGQGAFLLHELRLGHIHVSDPFFQMSGEFLNFVLTIATFVSSFAGVAIVGAVFTLWKEGSANGFLRRHYETFPNKQRENVVISFLNITLQIGAIIAILWYKSSTEVEAAYGFTVQNGMLFATIMIIIFVRGWKLFGLIGLFFIDVILWIATAYKSGNGVIWNISENGILPTYGGLPVIAVTFLLFLTLYIYYKKNKEIKAKFRIMEPLQNLTSLLSSWESREVPIANENHIVLSKGKTDEVEVAYLEFLKTKFQAIPKNVFICHIQEVNEVHAQQENPQDITRRIHILPISLGTEDEHLFKKIVRAEVDATNANISSMTIEEENAPFKFYLFLSTPSWQSDAPRVLDRLYFFIKGNQAKVLAENLRLNHYEIVPQQLKFNGG
jgi:KUP system potassium uptake protein